MFLAGSPAMDTYESTFDDALEVARALLGGSDGAADLCEANDLVSQALSIRPRDPQAWTVKAQVLSALGDDTAALAAIEMATRCDTHQAESHYWRAAILADLECWCDALQAIDDAFRAVEIEDEWLVEDIFYDKATILQRLGRHDDATAILRAGLERCPDSPLLQASAMALQRESARSRFTVLDGGRR